MFNLLLLVMFTFANADTQTLIEQRNFLDRTQSLQKAISSQPSPKNIREYITFVTEYYSKQATYRVFFMRNLLPGEHLTKIRMNQSQMINSDFQKIVETNMAELLQQAKMDFPNSLDIDFAIAQYNFSGRCCLVDNKNSLSTDKILEIFTLAFNKGIQSPKSLYALALQELNSEEGDRNLALKYLREAHATNPFDSEIVTALTNEEIHQKNYTRALQLSRILFEMAATTDDRMSAFAYSARSLIALEDYPTALNFIKAGLKVEPRNTFLWMLGLEALRNSNAKDRYFDHIGFLINQDPYNPRYFKSYTDYIAAKGGHQWDLSFADQYALESPQSDDQIFFQQLNLATLYHLLNQDTKALKHLDIARKKSQDLGARSASLIDFISQLEAKIKQPEAN